mmetsp:Transcript_13062/g.29066  ORF Transcript_13062/g.29066 Transcript_13062/m.29066 type:complete len:333 (+) Transcript_13062:224-1222(+)
MTRFLQSRIGEVVPSACMPSPSSSSSSSSFFSSCSSSSSSSSSSSAAAAEVPEKLVLSKEDTDALAKRYSVNGAALLVRALRELPIEQRAMPSISGYRVKAAALGSSGRLYFGVNVEIPGHPLSATVHAEQFIVASAALHDEEKLTIIAVNAAPCGHCRQFLQELPDAGNINITIYQPDSSATSQPLSDLLPQKFGPEELGMTESLLGSSSPRSHKLVLPQQIKAVHDIGQEALQAASRAYVPYSNCPAGAAIRLKDGRLFGGFAIESVAFNPALPPLQVAIVNAIAQGALSDLQDIDEIALVELARAKASFSRTSYLFNKRFHVMHAALQR